MLRGEGKSYVQLWKEPESFSGGWESAGLFLTEESIAVAGDQHIAEVSQWQRDEPEQGAEDLPAEAKSPQNANGCGRFAIAAAFDPEHHGVEVFNVGGGQQAASRVTLKWGKLDALLLIANEHEVDGLTAESANAIEKQNAFDGFFVAVVECGHQVG